MSPAHELAVLSTGSIRLEPIASEILKNDHLTRFVPLHPLTIDVDDAPGRLNDQIRRGLDPVFLQVRDVVQ